MGRKLSAQNGWLSNMRGFKGFVGALLILTVDLEQFDEECCNEAVSSRGMGMEEKESEQTANPKRPKGLLYHYTGLDGLMGIIEHDNLRATHVRYLNDLKEFLDADDYLDCLLEEFEPKDLPRIKSHLTSRVSGFLNHYGVYSVSFTDDETQSTMEGLIPGDRLSQWNSYSRSGNGFSLGFDSGAFSKSGEPDNWRIGESVAFLIDCVYQVSAKRRTFKDLSSSKDEDLEWNFLVGAMHFKHPAFFEEKEWRIVICNSRKGGLQNESDLPIKFRNGVFGVTPFIELPLGLYATDSPLRKIVVGPTPHKDEAIAAVKLLLESKGIKVKNDESQDGVEVVPSNVPYRNW
jgi:hypothetical protein